MKFMYGASVKGIQQYIFETNKLREIVGASEIVEQICTDYFKEFINGKNVEVILSAAGNIKIKAESKDDIEQIVQELPRKVARIAPGITISQAVVELSGNDKDDILKLEGLLKTQRNKQGTPTGITGLGICRSPRTGCSAVKADKSKRGDRELIDLGTMMKREECEKSKLISKLKDGALFKDFSCDMAELTSDECGWLAVIHADGNKLGKIIQNLPESVSIKTFSEKLNDATVRAAKESFGKIIEGKQCAGIYPIRPIVVGGDDLTVICRANLALDFTKTYLKAFENETINIDGRGKDKFLTASAGIAFVKESYPFYYAVGLADELCKSAKAKTRDNAGIAFHKIKSSFTDSLNEIIDRELTAGDVSFYNGPYLLREIDQLQEMVKVVLEKDAPKSGIRKWLSELHRDKNSADQLMDRIVNITNLKYIQKLKLGNLAISNNITHLYDVLAIASLTEGE